MTERTITVRVTPKAASNRVQEQEDGSYRVYVTSVPEDGKANEAVLRMLSKHLKIAKSHMKIVRGQQGRDKVIRLMEA